MQEETPSTVGELIRAARRDKSMTQIELAELAGTSQSQLSSFESGRSGALAREKISEVAKILNIDLTDILKVKPERMVTPSFLRQY